MRIVSIADEYLKHFGVIGPHFAKADREFMFKRGRPCIVVVRLRFRGKKCDFAVPLRSNIAPNVPKDQYFALPPRAATKPRHRHGIHHVKMFPIKNVSRGASERKATRIMKPCSAFLIRTGDR